MISPVESREALDVTALPFGVKVTNIRLEDASVETCEELRNLAYHHKLLVIAGQKLSAKQYVEFGRKIATPQVYLQENYHHPEFPEIFVSANGPIDGKSMGVARTGYFWHSDCSFQAKPLAFTMIYPQILPKGERSTNFMDMEEALQRLPAELRERIFDLYALHDGHSRYKITESDVGKPLHEVMDFLAAKCPYAIHPVVIRHPVTLKPILYLNSGFASRLLGMSTYESWSLLSRIYSITEKMDFAKRYEWQEGDIAIWDNRALLHRSGAVPKNEVSAMFRIGLYDDLPFASHTGVVTEQARLKEIFPCF